MEAEPHHPRPTKRPDTVSALHPDMGGRWLVQTMWSQHVWDLDAMTYQRLPGEGAPRFDLDGEVHAITHVGIYPAVGASSLVFIDDPERAWMELWRVSATIRSISRLPEVADPSSAADG